MKRQTKLTQQEQEQLAAGQQQTQSTSAQEFASVEEMLRHDALHTPVPPERQKQGVGSETSPMIPGVEPPAAAAPKSQQVGESGQRQRASRLVRAPSNRWQKARRKPCARSSTRLRGRRSTRCARRSWSRYLDKSRNGGDCGASCCEAGTKPQRNGRSSASPTTC